MKCNVFLLVLTIGLGLSAFALHPQIVYRGRLDSIDESVKNKDYQMKFSLYDDRSKGSALWSVTIPKVSTDGNGVFQVALEDWRDDYVYPAAQTNITLDTYATLSLVLLKATEKKPIYIGLTVGNNKEMVPRRRYYPMARANRAELAYSLAEGGTVRAEAAVNEADVAGLFEAKKVKTPVLRMAGADGGLMLSQDPSVETLRFDLRETDVFTRGSDTWTDRAEPSDSSQQFAIALVTSLDVANDSTGDTPEAVWLAPACIVPIQRGVRELSGSILVNHLKARQRDSFKVSEIYRWIGGVK